MDKTTLLITGALGHIGSHLLHNAPTLFPNVHLLLIDDLSTMRYSSLFNLPQNGSYTFIEGRIQDMDLASLMQHTKAVIHLAAITDAAGTAHDPEGVYRNNFSATQKIAMSCLRFSVPLIFPSSTSVYGSQSSEVDETCTTLEPQSPYARCKIQEEDLIKGLFEEGLRGVILRLGTIYGPSPGMRFHTAVNKFCWQAVLGHNITVWATAMDQKRPYLCLKDAGRALAHIIHHDLDNKTIYNIVSNNHTVRNVIENIQKVIHNLRIDFVTHQIMNQLSYNVSNARFQNTGFVFQGCLETGVQDTLALLAQANTHRKVIFP
jgi:UDP-glucose 4-epimerase